MATQKHRYQVGFTSDTEAMLKHLSKTQNKSISRIAEELVEKALEYDEDAYLCKLVEENERKSDGKTISMEEFWKENDLRTDEEYE